MHAWTWQYAKRLTLLSGNSCDTKRIETGVALKQCLRREAEDKCVAAQVTQEGVIHASCMHGGHPERQKQLADVPVGLVGRGLELCGSPCYVGEECL